jgi:uncharacterized protein (TIGR04255 family)
VRVELPEYDSVRLARSPLVLVAAQVNFEEVGREVSHAHARAFQRSLGSDRWPVLQSAPLVQATMTPGGVVTEPNRQAYRLANREENASLLINPDSVTLESRAYTGWDAFRGDLTAVVAALADVFDPGVQQRLGLRYIDQIPLPEGEDDWQALVRESLLGLSGDTMFADSIVASDQRVLLQLDDGIRCVLRHGQLAEPATDRPGGAYLLDFDVYREGGLFDPAAADAGADVLHGYVGRLFRACITDRLYAWLKG